MSRFLQDEKPHKPRRSFRWRFGIRTLLAFTLLVALTCAWFTHCAKQQATEAEAIAYLNREFGGSANVLFDYQCDELGEPISFNKNNPPEPSGPWLLRRILGEPIFSRVASVSSNYDYPLNKAHYEELSKLKHLKRLHLNNYDNCRDLNKLTNLRNLRVSEFSLDNLEPIASLQRLKKLVLDQDALSAADTEIIGTLRALEELEVNSANAIRNLDWAKNLVKLRVLRIRNALRLDSLQGLEKCSDLTDLYFEGSRNIDSLAPLRHCRQLKSIQFTQSETLVSLSGIEELKQLEKLDLSHARKENLPGVDSLQPLRNLTQLKTLRLHISPKVESLNALADLKQLEWLSLAGATSVDNLNAIAGLNNLKLLLLPRSAVQDLTPLSRLRKLKMIQFSQSKNLTNLDGISHHRSLEECDFSECQQLRDITPLGTLKVCKDIRLRSCSHVDSLEGLESLVTLEVLLIPNCDKIEDLKPLAGLPAIHTLDISGCSNITSLEGLKTAALLWDIKFNDCELLSDVSALAGCDLPALNVRNCPAIESLSVLSQSSIDRLDISSCANLFTVGLPRTPPIKNARPYNSVSISDCDQLNRLTVPQSPQGRLGFLAVVGDRATDLLDSLPDDFQVKTLTIRDADGMKDINSITKLEGLEVLNLFNCDDLTNLQALSKSQTLDKIFIKHCDSLTELSLRQPLPCLSTATIWSNPELETLDLQRMPMLSQLRVFQCPKLTTVPGLDDLSHLNSFELKDCGKIQPLEKLKSPILRFLSVDDINFFSRSTVASSEKFASEKLQKRDSSGVSKSRYTPSTIALTIRDCSRMTNLDWLNNIPDPHALHLGKASQLKQFTAKHFPELRFLTINDAIELDSITLGPAPITNINLIGCNNLAPTETGRQLLEHAKSIEYLSLSGEVAAATLPHLHSFPNLRKLVISNCRQLVNGQQLLECTAEEISLIDCGQLISIKEFCDSAIANRLTLANCPAIQDLDSIRLLETLEILTLKKLHHDQIRDLRFGPNCGYLFIEDCENLSKLKFESRLQPLGLYINSCPKLETIKLNPSNTRILLDVANCRRLSVSSIEEIKRRNGTYSVAPKSVP